MAELNELRDLFNDDVLRNKITAATVIAAYTLLQSVDANEKALAKSVLESPVSWGRVVMMTVLAANEGLTVAQISGASKTAIQNNVNTALPLFAGV